MIHTLNHIVAAIVATFPGVDAQTLSPQTHFADIPGWDSMSSVSFQMELETRIGGGQLDFVIDGDQTLESLAAAIVRRAPPCG